MFHWLAHALRLNYVTVYTWWDKEDLMVGFKCTKCGDILSVHKSLGNQTPNVWGINKGLIMSDTLSKVFKIERIEVMPAPHKFINTHEDYVEGYNDCVREISQYEIDVEKLRELMDCESTKFMVTDDYGEASESLAQHLASNASKWIVRKQ